MGTELKRIKDVLINKDYKPGKPGNKAFDEWLKNKGWLQAMKIDQKNKKGKK